jgi:hypothetical protein
LVCIPCQTTISVRLGGIHQLKQHNDSVKCKRNRQIITNCATITQRGLIQLHKIRVQRAEIIFAACIAKEDLSINKASQLIISNRHMFVDSQVAQDMSESRAKATAIIKNVISPVYQEELVKLLKVNKFGLLVDETTTIEMFLVDYY